MLKEIQKRSDCPFSCALDIFGDKWSLLIIRNLMFYDLHTYGDFLKMPEKIATNILADRLSSLENSGLISKEGHPESKAKILYKLTQKGIDLLPMMIEMSLWSAKYFEISTQAKGMMQGAKNDKAGFIKTLQKRLQEV